MWLSWNLAAVLAAGLATAGLATRQHAGRYWAGATAVANEASLVAALYSVWQLIGGLTPKRVTGAIGHGLWVWHVEQALHFANELSIERTVLHHPLWIQTANGLYAVVHVPALGLFLLWLFFRHRDRYSPYRNGLAVLTLLCLLIHLVPVAPPRLLPSLGFVDPAQLYHQSVYGPVGTGISDQVSAMPSLHVAWAALIALAVIRVSPSRWRWLILAHPLFTMIVVVVTANHFWLDGIVAAALLPISMAAAALPRQRKARPVEPNLSARGLIRTG